MNLFALSGLLTLVACIIVVIVLLKNPHSIINKLCIFFTITVGIWGLGSFRIGLIQDRELSLLWWKIAHIGVIFIPIALVHLIYVFIGKKEKWPIWIAYGLGVFFLITLLQGKLINNVEWVFDSFYYDGRPPTLLYVIFTILWYLAVFYAHIILFLNFRKATAIKRNQTKYFFFALFAGFSGGITCYFPVFGLDIYPYGNLTVLLYPVITTYAILRYRLMDISLVITRTGIFIATYSLVLGIPFALVFGWKEHLKTFLGESWWLVPLISSTVLATLGPFIYLFIQKRAEDRLLKEQRAYQATLQRASAGMGRVKDLKRLLDLIVHIVVRAVKLEHGEVFLWHEQSNQFVLKALKGRRFADLKNTTLSLNSPLILHFQKNKEALVYEEIKQRSSDYADKELQDIEAILNELEAALAVPSFIEDRLIAIIILGKKTSGKLYSEDDLTVFSILANQSALAIENAQFYEDMKNTQEQLFRAEKMATIGTMADGLSHQINNRLHAMGFIAGDALDSIALKKKEPIPEVMQGLINDLNYALTRIQDNVKQGGEIVQGLLKYTRKGEEGFSPIDLNKLLDSTVEMLQFKIKLNEMELQRKLQSSTPPVKGNFTQLQEVFFNIIDNSYDAIIQRKNELKEQGYKGCVAITAERLDGQLEITIIDNGMGVKGEDFKKLFTPFFTTKLSSRKGTGLGLYVIRQIIEENHKGKVDFSSTYQQGSQTKIYLPVAVV